MRKHTQYLCTNVVGDWDRSTDPTHPTDPTWRPDKRRSQPSLTFQHAWLSGHGYSVDLIGYYIG